MPLRPNTSPILYPPVTPTHSINREITPFDEPLCTVPLKVKPKLVKSKSVDKRCTNKIKITLSATTSPERLPSGNHIRKTIGRFCTFQKNHINHVSADGHTKNSHSLIETKRSSSLGDPTENLDDRQLYPYSENDASADKNKKCIDYYV